MQRVPLRVNKLLVCGLVALFLSACATVTEKQSTAQAPVQKGQPVVYIHPLSLTPYKKASIGIPPFLVPAHMGEERAKQVAALFKDVLLGKRVFPVVKQLPELYGDSAQAIDAGRKAGIDLVLAGSINYAMDGTELGGARVEVAVRLLNVESGNTVWYIGQGLDQPMDYPDNSFLNRALSSLSPPPIRQANGGSALSNMLSQIAVDMADVMSGSKYVRR